MRWLTWQPVVGDYAHLAAGRPHSAAPPPAHLVSGIENGCLIDQQPQHTGAAATNGVPAKQPVNLLVGSYIVRAAK